MIQTFLEGCTQVNSPFVPSRKLVSHCPPNPLGEACFTRMSEPLGSSPVAGLEQLLSLNIQYSWAVTKKFHGSRPPMPKLKKMM